MATLSDDVKAACDDVRNDQTPTNWLFLEYESDRSDNLALKGTGLASSSVAAFAEPYYSLPGSGGLEELKTMLDLTNAGFGFLRVVVGNDDLSQRVKFVFITWCGANLKSVMRKAKMSVHVGSVKKVIPYASAEIAASELHELDEGEIIALVKKSMGANYDGQSTK